MEKSRMLFTPKNYNNPALKSILTRDAGKKIQA